MHDSGRPAYEHRSENSARLEAIVARFEDAWKRTEDPVIDEFLPKGPSDRDSVLVELVHTDLEYRLKAGAVVHVGEYFDRYPELAADAQVALDLIVAEYELRLRREPDLSVGEYAERFPQYRDELLARLKVLARRRKRFPIRLNCPHCRNPIQIVDEDAEEDVVCPSCGSSFRLDPDRTVSWSPQELPHLGKFQLIKALGRGAFGTVYQARDTELDRIVAVKVPRSGRLATSEDEDRFIREGRSAARLRHPGIVPVYEVGRSDTFPYLVTEYVEGTTLSDALTARRFGFRGSAEIVAQVAESLDHAHRQGVVHRDLKPSNILLREDDDGLHALVMDFGLARRDEGEVTITVEGQILGTPAYMSPEQASGEAHKVDGRTDVYGAGVILYELLAGELPFRGNSRMLLHQVLHDEPRAPRALNDRIPRDLETICLKAMAKEPARRYQCAAELAADLHRCLKGQPIKARPVGITTRSWRWCQRNPAVASLTAAVILVLLAGTGVASYFAVQSNVRAHEAIDSAALANAEKSRADRVAVEAQANAAQSRHRLARLHLANGLRLMDEGDLGGSLPWFVEALRLDQGDAEREEIHRTRLGVVLRQCPRIIQLLLHDDRVVHAEFSVDGSRIATASFDGTARVWDVPTGSPVTPPLKHKAMVRFASFSSDGKRLVTASGDVSGAGEARLWDATTGKPLCSPFHETFVAHAVFSSDGQRVVTAGYDGTARIWDGSTGEPLVAPFTHSARVRKAAFSPDDRLLVTASGDPHGQGDARIWDAKAGQLLVTLKHRGAVVDVSFSLDGTRVLTASEDGVARVWDAATGKARATLRHSSPLMQASFSPAGAQVLTVSTGDAWFRPSEVRVWDASTGDQLGPTLNHESAVLHASFSPDGRKVLTTSTDYTTRIWAIVTGEPVSPPLHDTGFVWHASFSPDGRHVVTASGLESRGEVRLWDIRNVVSASATINHTGPVYRASFSPDGRRVLSVAGGDVLIWNSDTGKRVFQESPGGSDASFSADGRQVVVVRGAEVRVLDSSTGKLLTTLKDPGNVLQAAFSPDGLRIVTAGGDPRVGEGTARLWDVATGEPITPPLKHDSPVACASFSPDGSRVVTTSFSTTSFDGTVQIWDATTGVLALPPLKCGGKAFRASFSPNGERVLAALGLRSGEGEARLWDTATGESVGSPFKHAGYVTWASSSPHGSQVVTASNDHTARVWDADTGEPVSPPLRHQEAVRFAQFSPDGRLVVTASGDSTGGKGVARVWDASSGEAITPPLRHDGWVIHASFSPNSRRIVTGSIDETARVWDLSPENRPVEDLVLLAQLYSGHRLDPIAGLVQVDTKRLQLAWKKLREK